VVGNKLQVRLVQVLANAMLLFAVFLLIMPYLYMISASFKEGSEIFSLPVKILPEGLHLGNYELLFGETNFPRWFLNSVFVSLSRMVIAVLVSVMAGYAFAKFDFRFKNLLFVLVLATLTLPIYVLIVPLYDMMVTLGWTDRYVALILPFAAQAIGVFLARQYLLSIPDEIMDAARVDGATEWVVFWRVVLPISTPVMAVLGILFFTTAWNDFIWPLVVIGPYKQEYGAVMAGSFLSTLPIIIVFLIAQRRFIEALTAGAVKG
jgi:ABC-type glycerol-3-phosphate transport system permease component